jgi:hypothetical protein
MNLAVSEFFLELAGAESPCRGIGLKMLIENPRRNASA